MADRPPVKRLLEDGYGDLLLSAYRSPPDHSEWWPSSRNPAPAYDTLFILQLSRYWKAPGYGHAGQ